MELIGLCSPDIRYRLFRLTLAIAVAVKTQSAGPDPPQIRIVLN